MGQLKPNTTYIYETVNGVIYARELGSSDRTKVGYPADPIYKDIAEKYHNEIMWNDIKRLSKVHPALKNSLDQLILLYNLVKNEETNLPPHHPV